jgi:aminomethyltransferase
LPKVVPLHTYHEKYGHLTDFGGFSLPLWYKGIIAESLAVRNSVGLFDVSHMGRALIRGIDAQKFLEKITTNDVSSLKTGQGQYSLICNPKGGIKDDILVFRLQNEFLLVYNAANRSKDYDWIQANSTGDVEIQDVSDEVGMFALQGPKAFPLMSRISNQITESIPRFGCAWVQIAGIRTLVSRTGYTGEDGYEIFVWGSSVAKPETACTIWDSLLSAGSSYGIEPCGLGARDVLRLEAGLCLYGTDIDENTNPLEARLGFAVKFHKEFIGKQTLLELKAAGHISKTRIGLATLTRVIPRHGFEIFSQERKVGNITSGTLSPTTDRGIAMGYVEDKATREGDIIEVKIRERFEKGAIVKPPFYDPGKFGHTRKISHPS